MKVLSKNKLFKFKVRSEVSIFHRKGYTLDIRSNYVVTGVGGGPNFKHVFLMTN